MSGASDGELDDLSRRLLEAMDEMRSLEEEKRGTPRSSPAFHDLAEDVEEKARRVWGLAREERHVGEEDSPHVEEHQEQRPGDWAARSAEEETSVPADG